MTDDSYIRLLISIESQHNFNVHLFLKRYLKPQNTETIKQDTNMRNLISISALAAKYKRENKTLSIGPKLKKKSIANIFMA